MSSQRPNYMILLAIFATVIPTSFLAAATRITEISFAAKNFGVMGFPDVTAPVDPVGGGFRFEFDESLLTAGTGHVVNLAPTAALVNFDDFTTANIRGSLSFFSGRLGTFFIGSVPGCNDCIGIDNIGATGANNVSYSTSASTMNFIARAFPSDEEPNVIFKTETRVSGS